MLNLSIFKTKLTQYFNTERFYIFIIFLVSLLPFWGYEEFNFAMVRVENLNFGIFFGTWVPENFGTYNIFFNPYEIIIWLISLLIGSKHAIIIYLFFLQFFAGYFFFKLCFYFFKNFQIAFVASLFYILSIYSQFMSLWGIYSGGMVYSTVPFFVYHIVILNKENFRSIYAKLIIAYLFLISVNLTYIIYLQVFLFFIFALRYIYEKSNLRFFLLSYLINLFLNFILISPYFITNFMQNYYDSYLLSFSIADEDISWKSSSSSIGEVLRGIGSVNFDYKNGGFFSYINSRVFFENIFLVIISYYSAFVFFVSIFFFSKNKKIEKIKIFILMFYLVIFFLGLGVNKSFYLNFIYKEIYERIPLFGIFRDTYKINFMTNFIYAFSIGYFLFELINNKRFKLFLFSSYLVVFSLSFNYLFTPFFKYELVKIPRYWNTFANFSREKITPRLLLTPGFSFSIPFNFTSKYGASSDFYRTVLGYNIILPQKLYRFKDTSNFLYQNKDTTLYAFYGISYILNIKDADYSIAKVENPFLIDKELIEKGFIKINDYE